MRLAGKMVAGFYPTPPTVTTLLATLLVAPRGGRLLDPCAGLGVFAATLARDLGLESYGVEINDTRAGEAAMPLDHLLHTDALKLTMTHESVGLLALNPPYDYDDEVRRLEHAFLLKTTPYVQPGGVLALLVPQQRLSVSASYLTAHYTDIRVWRFPDEEYQAYRQVVLLARKKAGPERDAAAARALTELAKGELEPLTAGACPPYAIPRAGAAPLFAASELDPLAAAREAGAEAWPTLAGRLWPREAPRIRPLMPMKKGHVAQFAVAGLLSNVVLHDEAGNPFVVKGQAEKSTVVKVAEGEDSVTRTERDVLQTRLTLLDVRRRRFIAVDTGGAIRGEATARGDGEDPEDRADAAPPPAPRSLGETMGLDTFLERFKESITARILADYRPLYTPLQRDLYADRLRLLKRRLMGAQSDVVRAVALALRSGRRGVFVNGKMGTGKTTVSLAAAWCHEARSILVLCPPHLTRKWQREVLATVPGARVGIATTPADLHAILDTPMDRWHQGPLVTIISRERAKLRYATLPCAVTRTVRVQGDDGALVTRARLSCPDCGRLLVDKEGVPLTMAILKRRKQYCADCRAALWQADRTGPRRVALADYIKAQLPRAYDLLIADEVHQFRGRGTAQGFALATLAGLIPQTLALTGTLFNGLSTSLFYLMYRLIPEVRAEFGVNDETAWAARYGILERVTVYRENEEAREDGAQSKRRSGNTRVEEKPGIMPALVVRLVEHTVFMNLADVAEGLPPYDEGFTLYDMTDAQASCYAALYRTLHDELIAALHGGGAGKLLGAYLQKLLTYADTCWDARWTDEPSVGRQLDAAEVYPKEQALADYCRRERGRARRVLVYVKHVGERDITARLARVLADAGCRVAVLKADTVPSDEREEWFERQVRAGVDVVITNPTLVETGLDLLAFPSIRFHEIEYDTNTLSQATKRSWRIGQDRPVEVTFTGYRGTIQTNGLARVASKLRASYQADGDLMSGGLADFGDDGDFFRDLARSIAAGEGTGGDGLEALYAEARAAAADGGGEILTDEEREARERVAVAVVTEAAASASAGVTVDLDHLRAAYYAAGKPKGVSDAQLSFFDVDLAG